MTARQPGPKWTEFEEGALPNGLSPDMIGFTKVWMNNHYQVNAREIDAATAATGLGLEGMTWLSIKRLDKLPVRDWRDLQRIKNEICGREREAVEIYPAESRLVDAANQFHLWVMPRGQQLPFGFTTRDVSGPERARAIGARQRAFDNE